MGRAWWPVLLLAAVLVPLAGLPVAAQEEEDLVDPLLEIRDSLDRARMLSDELDFPGVVVELAGVIGSREGMPASQLSLEELRVVSAAYELRARAYFNMGDMKKAEADFQSLLVLAPSYLIDRQILSPKVVDLFDRVRGGMVGILKLQVEPPGARVLIDDVPVDPELLADLALLAGRHELRVEEKGYDPHAEMITTRVGTELRINIRLRPNRRAVEFITVPAGTTVLLNGERIGTTRGPATPDVVALAERFEFDPAQASAPLRVPDIPEGEHVVTFQRDCYRSRSLKIRIALDLEQNAPLRVAPVILQEAPTELRVTSVPDGAEVFIDGNKAGTTPVKVGGLCGGDRQIDIVKRGVGRWSERVRLALSEVNALDVRLRPTLMYAGTFRMDEWGRVIWSDEDGLLLEALGRGLKTLNLVRDDEVLQPFREAIIQWMIADPVAARAGTLVPPDLLDRADSSAGADLVLAGLAYEGDRSPETTLALYSTLHALPDTVRLQLGDGEAIAALLRRLDQAPRPTEPWWGMGLADTLLPIEEPGGRIENGAWPVVVRVLPGSPAAKAGMQVGDRVRAVESKEVSGAGGVQQAVAAGALRGGGSTSPVVLAVHGAGGQRTVRLAPGESPVLIPLSDPDLLYNRALAEYRLRSRAASDETERGVAFLNMGIALMHFRAYDKAITQGFVRADLADGSGISRGTVAYYTGLCNLRRGDPGAARAALKDAARSTASTLDSGDGPSAAAAARRLLKSME